MRVGAYFDNIAAIRGNTGPVAANVMIMDPVGRSNSTLAEYKIMPIKICPIVAVDIQPDGCAKVQSIIG